MTVEKGRDCHVAIAPRNDRVKEAPGNDGKKARNDRRGQAQNDRRRTPSE
ncbi:MAG: hypothetical protein NTW48_07015 [Chloroflexi bacterium]|nr:hypothetical protein [Chloroflexota bacterium]